MTRKKGSHRLNPRQWAYLQAIFALDQEQEEARRSWRARWGGPPAAEWRWIPYHTDGAPLWQRLREAGVCDPGTGSTFTALARRGLIRCKHQRSPLGKTILWVQLTKPGRALVRKARGIAPERWPVGVLREWHWRALCRAWSSGEQGMRYNEDLQDGFGYVSWNTCLRLMTYRVSRRSCPLLREDFQTSKVLITEEGKQFYREHWQEYRQRYPQVDAPAPS